jgi:tetratricopeptide (TPR) repeat protein
MKNLLALACLFLISLQPLCAQRNSKGAGLPRQQNPSQSSTSGSLFLSGKVVLNDGSVPSGRVLIQSICAGQTRTEAHADSHGNFSFQFGDRVSGMIESGFDAESPSASRSANRSAINDAKNCELAASLAGFSSDKISLDGRINGSQNVDVGRIVLHRLTSVEGLTISATTAAAPSSAKKAFSKGQEQKQKNDWEEAKRSFEKATRLFPKFAPAWFELGNVQMQQKDLAGARQSFEQAIAADEKYTDPYHALMRLSVGDQNWHTVIEISDKLLALNPINFPDAWYFNGVGYFCLENFSAAERSARRGLATDGGHRVPKLEYLLGMALLKTNAYAEAARHMQTYLHMASNPVEIAEAQRQLSEIQRLSANTVQGTPQNR